MTALGADEEDSMLGRRAVATGLGALVALAALWTGVTPPAGADPCAMPGATNLQFVKVDDTPFLYIQAKWDPPTTFPACPPLVIGVAHVVQARDVTAGTDWGSVQVGSFGPDYPGSMDPGKLISVYHAGDALLQQGHEYQIRVYYQYTWNTVAPDPPEYKVFNTTPLVIDVVATPGAKPTTNSLEINPTSIDFGQVPVKGSISQRIEVTNRSDAKVSVSVSKGTKPFSMGGKKHFTLGPGQTTDLYARVSPTAPGPIDGSVTLFTGDGSNYSVDLHVAGKEECNDATVCPPGAFTPWTGTWILSSDSPPSMKDGRLVLAQTGDTVTGHLTYTSSGLGEDLPISGKPTSEKRGDKSSLLLKQSAVVSGEKFAFAMEMSLNADPSRAYRRILVYAPQNLLTSGDPNDHPDIEVFHFDLAARDADAHATLCSTIRSGASSVKAGKPVTFGCFVGNTGPACLPSDRIVLRIDVSGGTIDPNHFLAPRASATQLVDPHRLIVTLGSLGDGKKANGVQTLLAVVADPDATEVKCTCAVDDPGASLDTLVEATTPPDRSWCVPVIQPDVVLAAKRK